MTTQKDELARDIFLADNSNAAPGLMEKEWDENATTYHYAHSIAEGLIAKGYRKPRTITSLAELAALPAESALQTSDRSDTVVLKGGDGLFINAFGGEVGPDDLWRYGSKPFTLIYEPEGA